MTQKEWIGRLLRDHEHRLEQAEDAWQSVVAKIRDNPNQLNPYGIWVGDMLADMVRLHAVIVDRDRQLRELKTMIAELERKT